MPTAIIHILVPLILVAIFRDFILSKERRRSFPLFYVLIAGLAGTLPDVDLVITWITALFGQEVWVHRILTHSFVFFLFFVIFGLITLTTKSKQLGKHHLKISTIFFLISFGILTHILLDMLVHGGVALYYPISDIFIGLNLTEKLTPPLNGLIIPTIEGILVISWLLYLELKHKISDFV